MEMQPLFLETVKDKVLINVQQAARLLGVSPKTIRKWARLKKVRGFKLGSRGDWRFDREEIMKLLQEYVEKGGGKDNGAH